MSAIRLEINTGSSTAPEWQAVYLPDDTSISIEDNSIIWNDASTYSYGFKIPIEPNRHILGNADHMHGANIYKLLYKKPFRLWVDGIIFRVGYIKLDDEIEIGDDGTVEIELTSGRKTLDDLLEGVSCRDIDLERENILIGYCNNVNNGTMNDPNDQRSEATLDVRIQTIHSKYASGKVDDIPYYKPLDGDEVSEETIRLSVFNALQQLTVVPDYEIYAKDTPFTPGQLAGYVMSPVVNDSRGYDEGFKFCHIPICYQLYQKDGDNWNKKRGYQDTSEFDPGGPGRQGSAPCFFVLYIIDLLFKQFGIPFSNTMKNIADLNRLMFIHTDWHARVGDKVTYKDPDTNEDVPIGPFVFDGIDGEMFHNLYKFGKAGKNEDTTAFATTSLGGVVHVDMLKTDTGKTHSVGGVDIPIYERVRKILMSEKDFWDVKIHDSDVHYAYATSENLPDADASEVIEGLETMFGARFMYDDVHGTCRVVMLRDVLSQNASEVIDVADYTVHPKRNHTNGFRLKYSESTTFEANELQKANGTDDVIVTGSDNTNYNYNDWDKVARMNVEGGCDDPIKTYGQLINNVTRFDETCYVDCKTGNAYRIKVNSDANTADSTQESSDKTKLDPSLFEVGGFRDVEYGDCSDNDFVEEVSIGFTPVSVNDMNMKAEKEYWRPNEDIEADDTVSTPPLPIYSVFTSAELHPDQDVTVSYDYSVDEDAVEDKDGKQHMVRFTINERYPHMRAGWDVSQGFDSPLQEEDFGLTVGILRVGDVDGVDDDGVMVSNVNYDGKGNSKWTKVSTTKPQVTADSVDTYGNVLGNISLKLKAEKKNPYKYASEENPVYKKTYDPYKDQTDPNGYWPVSDAAAKRGLFDKFYTQYAYWVVNRKVAVFSIPRGCMSLIQLANIDFTRKYKIGGINGFINKMSYTVDKNGLGDVEIEMYYI